MSEIQRTRIMRGYVMPRHVVNCPHCTAEFQPSPFLGRALAQCPMCDEVVVLQTDGVSFGSSNVTASKMCPWYRRVLH